MIKLCKTKTIGTDEKSIRMNPYVQSINELESLNLKFKHKGKYLAYTVYVDDFVYAIPDGKLYTYAMSLEEQL